MEEILGRHLFENERVHHKNTDRSDNSPDNLELWITGHPNGGRVDEMMEWARTILERYSPTSK